MKSTPRAISEDSPEMDVDTEEKEITEEDEADAEEPEENFAVEEETPFLDSFYGISSPSAVERAQAGQILLHHALLGPDANTKDAAYAYRRLLNGLCSGRAAARQGNASTLAIFLKIAFALGKMGEIRDELQKEDEKDLTDLAFVRRRLRAATEPGETQGRRKGSEERDYQFGRLFGINGVVRSGILLPVGDRRADQDDIIETTAGFVKDLAELYQYKKWIREPVAHAVCSLLNSFFSLCPSNEDAGKVAEHVVESVVLPELLVKGDNGEEGDSLYSTYSAEQVAIVLNMQSQAHLLPEALPTLIHKAVLTTETMPLVAQSLSETSTVTQPRTHLVWDVLWSYITESSQGKTNVESRMILKVCRVSDESVDDLLGSIMKHVVIERLLGVDDSAKDSGRSTHERRALALCIMRNLSGVEFVSSLSGRTRLILESDILESHVFTPLLVRRLFLDVICAGQKANQTSHLLKSLALQVLSTIVGALIDPATDQSFAKRLLVAKVLLRCEPRFDSRTKTKSVEALLSLNAESASSEIGTFLWQPYLTFLEQQIVAASFDSSEKDAGKVSHESAGYIDQLFHLGKLLQKCSQVEEASFVEFRRTATKRIQCFLMAVAFFDFKEVDTSKTKSSKKKRKEGRKIATSVAALMKEARQDKGMLPFDIRSVASARFFSLVADRVVATIHSSESNKDSTILDFLSGIAEAQSQFSKAGARLLKAIDIDEMEIEDESPEGIVRKLQKEARALEAMEGDDEYRVKKRWAFACASLAITLQLHLLSCGEPDGADHSGDDPDTDEDEDIEEISGVLSDLKHVNSLYSEQRSSEGKPLTALAELSVNILSSPVGQGNQSRGASPTLFREIVKLVWVAGLSLSASSKEELDSSVVEVLLGAIGASIDSQMDVDHEEETDIDEEEDESESEDEEVTVTTNSFKADADADTTKSLPDASASQSEQEEEIDEQKLQSMLEEDSDADVEELEHHEGADAALAKLIQVQQDARKVGQLARERSEIARQIRCILLLETLIVGKAEAWGSVLRADVVLQVMLPILQYRRELFRSTEKVTGKGAEVGDKRSLLDRLTSLLKTKILKTKVAGMKWTEDFDYAAYTADLSSKLLALAKDNLDKEQQGICNSAIIWMLRSIPEPTMVLERATSIYGPAVSEWATKRTTKIDVSFFEGLIHQSPVLAQAGLCEALTYATSTARSSFLQAEAFRLLSLLYNRKLNNNESELEKAALKQLDTVTNDVVDAILTALQNDEMKKSKRVREVLKTAERLTSFYNNDDDPSHRFKELRESVQVLTQSESKSVASAADKLVASIDELVSGKRNDEGEGEGDAKKDADAEKLSEESRDKKKKKKGKKKKRR